MIPTTPFEQERADAVRKELSHLDLNVKHPKLQLLANTLRALFGETCTCAISYLDYEDAYFLAMAGPDMDKYAQCCRRDCLICSWAFLPVKPSALIVHDARVDRRFQALPLVINGRVVSYVGSPIVTSAGGTWNLPEDIPENFREIVVKCTNISPNNRPDIDWVIERLQSLR